MRATNPAMAPASATKPALLFEAAPVNAGGAVVTGAASTVVSIVCGGCSTGAVASTVSSTWVVERVRVIITGGAVTVTGTSTTAVDLTVSTTSTSVVPMAVDVRSDAAEMSQY